MKSASNYLLGAGLTGSFLFFIKIVLYFFSIPLLINSVGKNGYAIFVLVLGYFELISLLASGLGKGVVQRISHVGADGLLKALFLGKIVLFLSLIASAILFYLGLWLTPFVLKEPLIISFLQKNQLLLLFSVLGNITSYFSFYFLRGLHHQKTANLIETCLTILDASLLMLAAFYFKSLVAVFAFKLLALLMSLGISLFSINKICPGSLTYKTSVYWKDVFNFLEVGVFTLIQRVSAFVAHRIDEFVIAAFVGLAQVAGYAILIRLFSQLSALIMRVSDGLLPMFSYLHAGNEHERKQMVFLKISFALNFIILSLLGCVALVAEPLFNFMAQKTMAYSSVSALMWLLVIITWSGSVQIPASEMLVASGKHRFQAISSIITAASNLLISILLAPKLGSLGVLLGTFIPHLLQHQLVTIPVALKQIKIPLLLYYRQTFLRAFLSLGSLFALLWIFKAPTFLLSLSLPLALTATSIITLIIMIIAALLVLHKDEKSMIKSKFLGVLSKIRAVLFVKAFSKEAS